MAENTHGVALPAARPSLWKPVVQPKALGGKDGVAMVQGAAGAEWVRWSDVAHLFPDAAGNWTPDTVPRGERAAEAIAEIRNAGVDVPVAPKLTVWFGPMPESNGKTNWTAILHRGDMAEGFTIARSEHHDRVRYDADKVRWLIGETGFEPDILMYDGEMLSPPDYVHPCGVAGRCYQTFCAQTPIPSPMDYEGEG